MALDYWYDGQLRRYWLQFCRIFENFQYESGLDASGTRTLRTFPVSLATKNRQIGFILRNGSENTMLSTPRITCEQINIQQPPERRQAPNHVSTQNVWERAIDPLTNKYTNELGRTYSVERIMPVPYDITMRVNIWTSNEQQKHQFMEQVLTLFNPSIDLQTGDNPLDWTSLTIVELEDVSWSNRELPLIGDDDIEISTLTFKMPIWINPPAKLKRQNIIEQIITNISTMQNNAVEDGVTSYNFSSKDLHQRIIVTPGNHQTSVAVQLNGNGQPYCEITLLGPGGNEHDESNLTYDWRTLLRRYGQWRPGVSQFRLKTTDDMDDHDSDIIGSFDFHPTADNKILWNIDGETLPVNTMPSVLGMLDLRNGSQDVTRHPGDGVLPAATAGQRYLLASDLFKDVRWTNLEASVNDIIEYNGTQWTIAFDASAHTGREIVLNANPNSKKQLRWTGELWVDAIAGDYHAGYWRVFL